MKKFLFCFSQLCAVVAFLASCNEYANDVSPVAVFVTPDKSETAVVDAGDKVKYELSFYANDSQLSRFQIVSFDSYFGEVVCKDSLVSGDKLDYTFIYEAPETDKDSLDVTLRFYAWNDNERKCSTERYIKVKAKSLLLAEKTGIVLWQPSLMKPDALSFAAPTKTFHWETSSDSLYADLYVDGDGEFANVSLKSKTKAKFVRNNSFDYAAASSLGIRNVYASSIREDRLNDLKLNDVFLVGHDNQAEGVFWVTNIIRGNGLDGCCVQLSFKAVR